MMIERQQQVLREFVVDALAALDSMYETPEIDPDDDYGLFAVEGVEVIGASLPG
ncbi:hypothetical protein ACJH6H_23045 [Mycobacterium sp. SMC-21]|uniref:hypothetical protein n=1 Tax=Mycobacterium sp. SMC-21 TaxID=3381632 RepID=UPI0038776BF9